MSYNQQIAIYGLDTHFILPTSPLIQCDFCSFGSPQKDHSGFHQLLQPKQLNNILIADTQCTSEVTSFTFRTQSCLLVAGILATPPFGLLVCADRESETFRDLVCDGPRVKCVKLGLLFFIASTHIYLCYQTKVLCFSPSLIQWKLYGSFFRGKGGGKQVWV